MRSVRNAAPAPHQLPLLRHRHPRSARVGARANAPVTGRPEPTAARSPVAP
ncbi:MAG: hypothetical protein AAGF11_41290 [Myxococcota bacterium]